MAWLPFPGGENTPASGGADVLMHSDRGRLAGTVVVPGEPSTTSMLSPSYGKKHGVLQWLGGLVFLPAMPAGKLIYYF